MMLRVLLVLAVWCVLAAVLVPWVGAFCAWDEPEPVRERLDEIERDRVHDEMLERAGLDETRDPLWVG